MSDIGGLIAVLAIIAVIVIVAIVFVNSAKTKATTTVANAVKDAELKAKEAEVAFEKQKTTMRKESVEKSKSVIKGHIIQEVAPLIPGFPYDIRDAHFMGGSSPVDYIIFDGLGDPSKEVRIICLEVKTGKSRLNGNECRVRDAITQGRMSYEIWRLPAALLAAAPAPDLAGA